MYFPHYDSFELREIKDSLDKIGIEETLKLHKYMFTFNPYLIETFLTNHSLIDSNIEIFQLTVLYSYISLIQTPKLYLNLELSLPVMKGMLAIYVNSSNQIISTIIKSSVYNLLSNIFNSNENFDYSLLIPFLSFIFFHPSSLPTYTFDLLISSSHVILSDRRYSTEFISILDGITLQLGGYLPNRYINEIITDLSIYILELSVDALLFFSHLSNSVSEERMNEVEKLIVIGIQNSVKDDTQNSIHNSIEKIPFIEYHKTDIERLSDVQCDIPPLENTPQFPRKIELFEIIGSEIFTKMRIVSQALIVNKHVCASFIEMCKTAFDQDKEISIKKFATFFALFIEIRKQFPFSIPVQISSHKSLFNPQITVYGSELPNDIHTLRSIAIDFISANGLESIMFTLYNVMGYPLLFCEVLQRLIKQSPITLFLDNCAPTFAQMTLYPMFFYKSSNSFTKESSMARFCIFQYMNNYLLDKNISKMLFNDQFFIEYFSTLLYDHNDISYIRIPFLKYLTSKDAVDNENLIEKVTGIILKECDKANDNESLLILVDLFKIINEAMIQNPELSLNISTVIGDVCDSFNDVEKGENSEEYIIQSLGLIICCSLERPLTTPELALIEAVVRKIFGIQPPKQIFTKIIQLLSGRSLTNIHPSFKIKQPKVLQTFINIFKNSSEIIEVFTFISSLFTFSSKNCEAAHKSSFDNFLIQIIFKWRDSQDIESSIYESAIKLLMTLMSSISSVIIVRQFVSVLCPIDGELFPRHHQITMAALNEVLSKSRLKPSCAFPIDMDSVIEVNGFDRQQITNGFTISTWLYLNHFDPQYKPPIFNISDTVTKQEVGVFLQGNSCVIYVQSNEKNWSIRPNFAIPTKKWCLLAISFKFDNALKKCIANPMLNDEEPATLFLNYPDLNDQSNSPGLTLTIAGTINDSVQPKKPLLMSSFSVYSGDLKIQVMKSLFDKSLISQPVFIKGESLVMHIVPKDRDGTFAIIDTLNNSNLKIKHAKRTNNTPLTLSDVLVNKCGVDLLLPLFAQFDLTFSDKTNFKFYPELVIDLLENALVINSEGQKMFLEKNGFQIISHLLRQSGDNNINYSIYQRFFNIFGLITNKELQKNLLLYILFNVEIWLKTDSENHKRITRHWSRVLLPARKAMMCELFPFHFILSLLRSYYYYDGIEKGIIRCPNRIRGQQFDVLDARKQLFIISHIISIESFNELDFKTLISHILTVNDHKQTPDLLIFLREIIVENIILKKFQIQSISILPLLQYLFNLRNDKISAATISVIIESHKADLINDIDINRHIDIIMHQIPIESITVDFYTSILEMLEQTPELFPFVSWMAVNLGENSLSKLINNVKPSINYTKPAFWMNWLVVAIFNLEKNKQLKQDVIKYILNCGKSNILSIYASFYIIGLSLNKNYEDVICQLLLAYGQMIYKDESENTNQYFTFVTNFILFRQKSENNAILKLYNDYYNTFSTKSNQKKSIPNTASPKNRRRSRYSINIDYEEFQLNQESYSPVLSKLAFETITNKTERSPLLNKKRKNIECSCSISQHQDIKITKLSPSELNESIGFLSNCSFDYNIGLRFSQSGKWSDIELAAQAISIFEKIPDQNYSEIVIILCSFLLHEGVDVSLAMSKILQTPLVLNAMNFFYHHASETKTDVYFDQQHSSFEPKSFEYIKSLSQREAKNINASPLRYIKHFIREQEDASRKAMGIFGMISDEVVSIGVNVMAEFISIWQKQILDSEKLWNRYWQTNTSNNAPWLKSLPEKMRNNEHFKRDSCICPFFCPMKQKQSKDFSDHMDASLLRDTGSKNVMMSKLEDYRRKLAEEYSKSILIKNDSLTQDSYNYISSDEENSTELGDKNIVRCILELHCDLIKVDSTTKSTFTLMTNEFILTTKNRTKIVNLNQIKNIFRRSRLHHKTAIEVFTYDGKSYFIDFKIINSIYIILELEKLKLPRIQIFQKLDFMEHFMESNFTDLWIHRQISNFEYLMVLNVYSGRSFNDTSQYPIFPWIIKDYKSQILSLEDPETYRDLTKPIGAIGKDRYQKLLESFPSIQYLYGSGMSCFLAVYHYLIRVEPFTSLHIDLQDGAFDKTARLFTSIDKSYDNSTTGTNNYKELIPEFFFSPEIFENKNHFDLGSKNSDVELPNWAANPTEFVYLHRKALESDYVSQHLNSWIDLVFGVDQKREDNIFMEEMYSDIWNDKENMKNAERRASIEAILYHVGQIPTPLFKEMHPRRMASMKQTNSIDKPLSVCLCESKSVIISAIRVTQSHKYRINIIDRLGLSNACLIDAVSIATKIKLINSRQIPLEDVLSPHKLQRSRSGSERYPSNVLSSPRHARHSLIDREKVNIDVVDRREFVMTSKNLRDFALINERKLKAQYSSSIDSFIITYPSENDEQCLRVIKILERDDSKCDVLIPQRSHVLSLSCGGEWVVVSNKDATVSFYTSDNLLHPKFSVQSFTSDVRCSAISQNFHMSVLCTRDGDTIIVSLSSYKIVKTFSIGEKWHPVSVIITPTWGFILIFATMIDENGILNNKLFLYSVNGEFLKSCDIERSITSFETVRSPDGFDYILMSDDISNLYCFEAFYLDIGQPFFSASSATTSSVMISSVVELEYDWENSICIAVTNSGIALFIPLCIN
ncbi:Beige/BEACH domain containing protein [Trichomonas vaginalis G3]|uniref:Beige/BEACH domain containing protein n=1 Tax=Trichomonas vaginalis (strain ATCC PRA-98 / G3) TaxID=412133 RepID=A2G4L7_TRIV3|nr:beige/BEACH-related family [Trichomonas vaginalis G3]EAX87904.1 Beige/BEACH domain containing protein [Trichomonas vaginalis G3]KAI5538425.1 beige/BEACH-related family [Trichomonas vaginalis G3]|eukprot:XP_001300834.1 Beige/BEACH domain containing protein [Trichomonas vaginalis G3]